MGIHDGIYVRRNYTDQPQRAQLLSHANIQYSSQRFIGLKILAGIFPSHIGFESVRTDANLTASRSMLA
ncbi:MAG: porin, partial [Bacteroidetes bacterium]|nr:porin [Bacteroidota bacterium]